MSAPQSALFVGIGNMGWPMAARLLGAGIGYSLWKTRPAAEQVK